MRKPIIVNRSRNRCTNFPFTCFYLLLSFIMLGTIYNIYVFTNNYTINKYYTEKNVWLKMDKQENFDYQLESFQLSQLEF